MNTSKLRLSIALVSASAALSLGGFGCKPNDQTATQDKAATDSTTSGTGSSGTGTSNTGTSGSGTTTGSSQTPPPSSGK